MGEVEKPSPKENEILVKVQASTVNRTDCGLLRANPFVLRLITGLLKPKRISMGTEFSGNIVDLGKDVKSVKVGDKIFGFDDGGLGSHAEYMIINEDTAFETMPESISYQEAAASLEGAHYAYNFIDKVQIKPNQKALVNGATGAIGSAMVQLLKSYNVNVTATSRTENIELVKSIGADRVIDYTKDDFTESGEKFDFVFDTVGKSSFGKCKPLLSSGGVYISSELGAYLQNPFLALITSIAGNKKVKFPIPFNIKRSIVFIKKLIEEGKFKSVIDREYALEDIVKAYNYVETGEKIGNVVISI